MADLDVAYDASKVPPLVQKMRELLNAIVGADATVDATRALLSAVADALSHKRGFESLRPRDRLLGNLERLLDGPPGPNYLAGHDLLDLKTLKIELEHLLDHPDARIRPFAPQEKK